MPESEPNFFLARREQLGLTQLAVAIRLGITPSAVSNWENGQVPNTARVDDIARVYETTPRKILDAMHAMARERTAEKKPATAKA